MMSLQMDFRKFSYCFIRFQKTRLKLTPDNVKV